MPNKPGKLQLIFESTNFIFYTRCPQSKDPFLNASFAQIICRAGFKLYTYMANDRKFLFSKSSEVVHVLFSRRSEFVQKLDHT